MGMYRLDFVWVQVGLNATIFRSLVYNIIISAKCDHSQKHGPYNAVAIKSTNDYVIAAKVQLMYFMFNKQPPILIWVSACRTHVLS